VENDGRELFLGGKSTGGNYSYVEKRREGIIPRWQNDGRELFLGGKTMGGNYS